MKMDCNVDVAHANLGLLKKGQSEMWQPGKTADFSRSVTWKPELLWQSTKITFI